MIMKYVQHSAALACREVTLALTERESLYVYVCVRLLARVKLSTDNVTQVRIRASQMT